MLQDRNRIINIVPLAFTKHKIDRITISIHHRMDFCACPATAVPYFGWRPLFCTRVMLMGLDNGSIHGKFFQGRFQAEFLEDSLKNAIVHPFAEAAINASPWTKAFWQIPPGCTASGKQTMALSIDRLSFEGRPGFPVISGGSKGAICSHS